MTKASADFYDAYAAEINNTSGVWQAPITTTIDLETLAGVIVTIDGRDCLFHPDDVQLVYIDTPERNACQGDNDHETEIAS